MSLCETALFNSYNPEVYIKILDPKLAWQILLLCYLPPWGIQLLSELVFVKLLKVHRWRTKRSNLYFYTASMYLLSP